MKKAFWTVLLLMLLLVSSTGSAFAGAAIELISVTHDSGGVKFTFRVNGEFSNANLKGSGHINGGDDFVMDCAQKDETTVVCFAPHKAGGHGVAVTFGGATFWTDVPEQQSTAGISQYCYSVWSNSYTGAKTPWADFGPLCGEDFTTFEFPGGLIRQIFFTVTDPGGCGGYPYNGPSYYTNLFIC